MNVWKTTVDAGKTKLPTLLHAGYHLGMFFFFLDLTFGIFIATMTDYSYFDMNRHFRILLGEDCASALLFKVLNLLVTVTLTAKVNYFFICVA